VRIEMTGGFIPIEMTYSHYPLAALYADGRLIEPGAQPAIYPGPAIPTLARDADFGRWHRDDPRLGAPGRPQRT